MNVIDLIRQLKKFQTAKDVIEKSKKDIKINEDNDLVRQGFLYERLWDICVKFGLFKNDIKHININVNTKAIQESDCVSLIDCFDNYIHKTPVISGNSGGYSDISFKVEVKNTDGKIEKEYIYLSSCKYYDKEDETKNIKSYDIQDLCLIINNVNNKKLLITNEKFYISFRDKIIKQISNDKDLKNKLSSNKILFEKEISKYINDIDVIDKEKKDIIVNDFFDAFNKIGNSNDKIESHNYIFNVLLFVKDKKRFINIADKVNKSSYIITNYINKTGNYENVYDLNDLELLFKDLQMILKNYNYLETDADINKFKKIYLNDNKIKPVFKPRFHQTLFINKIGEIIKENGDNKKILIGAVPRSGKTYIMAGTILNYIKNNKDGKYHKFIILTPAPSETLAQYEDAFNFYDFDLYNIKAETIDISRKKFIEKFKKDNSTCHKVYFLSIQKLNDTVTTKKTSLKKKDCPPNQILNPKTNRCISINGKVAKLLMQKRRGSGANDNDFSSIIRDYIKATIIFIDEAHYAMVSNKSTELINKISNIDIWKIYITATYNKVLRKFNIPDKNKLFWSLSNVTNLQRISNSNKDDKVKRFKKYYNENLKEKFGDNYDEEQILNYLEQYKNFPEPCLLTTVWNDINTVYNNLNLGKGTNFTFNMNALFALNPNKDAFVNIEQVKELFHYYFGYPRKGIKYEHYPFYTKDGIMPRIEGICNNKCRTLQTKHKTTQLWFLPFGIDQEIIKVADVLLKFLKDYFKIIFERTLFIVATTKKSTNKNNGNIIYNHDTNIKQTINQCEEELKKNSSYDNLVIITGKRLQLGISLPNVDIVTLFNSIESADTLYQIMFRSMTEVNDNSLCDGTDYCPKKKYGFIVDLNPQRTLTILDYISNDITIDNDKKDLTKKRELITDLFNIDRDIFINKYDKDDKAISDFSNEIFNKLTIKYDDDIENIKRELDEVGVIYNIKTLNSDVKAIIMDYKEIKKNKGKTVVLREGVRELNENNKYKDIEGNRSFGNQKKANIDEVLLKKIKDMFADFIAILSIVTSNSEIDTSKIRCILDMKNTDVTNFKTDLNELLKDIRGKEELNDLFIYTIKDRFKMKDIDDDQLFDLLNNIIASIEKEEMKNGGMSSDVATGISGIIHRIKSKYYTINEPKELLEFIDRHIKPTTSGKKERGEVFTPMKLVDEMLDKLPPEVWTNKELKWLDPAAGMGNFPIAVYLRLMKNLKGFKTEEEKRKHILEKMLYMVELDKYNVFMMKKILCGHKYTLNIFEGSFIEDDKDNFYDNSGYDIYMNGKVKKGSNKDFEDKTKDMKFDIIMGNPPFNDEKQKSPIYNLFIEKSILLTSKYLLFIVPSRWFAGGIGLNNFRKMMLNRTDIEFINHFDNAKKIFGNYVEIKGGVNYFLINKNYEGLCNFNGSMIKLNRYDILVNNNKFLMNLQNQLKINLKDKWKLLINHLKDLRLKKVI